MNKDSSKHLTLNIMCLIENSIKLMKIRVFMITKEKLNSKKTQRSVVEIVQSAVE